MMSKVFKKYHNEKCTHIFSSLPKTITQIRPDDWTKGKGKAQSQTKAVILVPTPTHSVLKYLILLLQHPLKLKYSRC